VYSSLFPSSKTEAITVALAESDLSADLPVHAKISYIVLLSYIERSSEEEDVCTHRYMLEKQVERHRSAMVVEIKWQVRWCCGWVSLVILIFDPSDKLCGPDSAKYTPIVRWGSDLNAEKALDTFIQPSIATADLVRLGTSIPTLCCT